MHIQREDVAGSVAEEAAVVVAVELVAVAGVVARKELMKTIQIEPEYNLTTKPVTGGANNLAEPCFKLGVGWRSEISLAISRRKDLSFVEIVAENYINRDSLPYPLVELSQKGVEIIPHCISLSPGGSSRPHLKRIKKIDQLAKRCNAKLVSDHLCFVRAGGLESGHLLAVPRNKSAKRVILDNIKYIKENLSVPLALENIANICAWENQEYDEASFFAEILEESDCQMLLDVSNLYANSINHKFDAVEYLKKLPLDRLAYVHVAGGTRKHKFYHDTHAHAIIDDVYSLLQTFKGMKNLPKVMLERDDNFPSETELYQELDRIKNICAPGWQTHEQ